MVLRILLSLFLLISILFFPFWVSLIIGIFGIIYFKFFWEAIILFFISDLIFGVKENRFLGITIFSTLLIAIIITIAEFTKKKIRFENK
jgi:hypothetical protein